MASSEPLVPTGQPYGARKDTRAAMVSAGLPLAPTPNGASSPQPGASGGSGRPAQAGPSGPPGPLSMLLSRSPQDFPFLAEQANQPVSSSQSPQSVSSALAASAQSSFAQAVSARLNQILK